jgi:VCBS repeat-containing protein
MNSKTLLKCLCMCLVMFAILVNANAQDLKSILTGVAKAVVGDKATTSSSIIGTWKYVGPQCQFESENLLAKAGGEVAAKEVEEKMQTVYDRIGMSGCEYTFNEDGTYSYTLKKRTMSGTYTFDDKEKTITMKGKLGVKTVAHVTVTGNDMSLVFNADKLMSVLKTITGTVSKVNSTAATINSVAGSYDGLMLGFDLKK